MANTSVFVLRTGFCLLLLSSVSTVFAEHASPRASNKKAAGRGLRKGSGTSSAQLRKDMTEAVDEALGAGHGVEQKGLEAIRHDIEPMWRALVKNQQGRVDRRSLRYVVQRFFMQRHHLSVVGLEANLASDTQSEAALLTTFAPNYVKKVLKGDDARSGFVMEDGVAMIATIRRLIEHSGTHMLEDAYNSTTGMTHDVGRQTMKKVLEGYMLRWMMGDDIESIRLLEHNESLREASFDMWPEISQFVHGHVHAFEYAQQHSTSRSQVSAWNALRPHFSFGDAQAIVGSMALSFGGFWETECANVKASFLMMDSVKDGRVKLSDFHGAALNGEWRFSESKEYLRQMGALDETSSWQGPRVIITNYMQAPSNCIISTEHYRVCCANECEAHLDQLEESIGGAVATPEEILLIIERLTSNFDDEPRLTTSLRSQLQEIARPHSGKVPIHGRLFAQWLHYVFPLECPFPHKSGTTTTLSPLAFGEAYIASEEEMSTHGSVVSDADAGDSAPEEDFMSQWSHEEELLSDLSQSSWEADFSTSVLGLMLMAGVGILLMKSGIILAGVGKDVLPTRVKSHYV